MLCPHSHSQGQWGTMGVRSQRTLSFVPKQGDWDGWRDLCICSQPDPALCVSTDLSGIPQPMVPTLDVSKPFMPSTHPAEAF